MEGNKKGEPKKEVGRWRTDEHERFMAAIAAYGKDWKKVEEIVGTRSGSQVRSHAQKFFNKLLKDETDHKNENVGKKLESENENDGDESSFMKLVNDDNSNNTPIEIVTLIRGESQKEGGNKVNIKNFQKTLEEQLAVINEENNEEQLLNNLSRQKSYKSMNNILEAYENIKEPTKNNLENESFLMGLAKHYKKYFSNDGLFESLIDFGNVSEVEQLEKQIRKRSFTLPEGVEGGENDLNERKKRVITQQSTAKLNETEKLSFQNQLKKIEEQSQNEGKESESEKKM